MRQPGACRSRKCNINLSAPDTKAQILAPFAVGQDAGADHRRADDLGQPRHPGIPGRASSRQPVWPEGEEARAVARSVSAEMHSGFRRCASIVRWISPPGRRWPRCRTWWRPTCVESYRCGRTAAPDLAPGDRSCSPSLRAADAMYAPVASRFRTYISDLATYGDDGVAQGYVDALLRTAGHARLGGGRARATGGRLSQSSELVACPRSRTNRSGNVLSRPLVRFRDDSEPLLTRTTHDDQGVRSVQAGR